MLTSDIYGAVYYDVGTANEHFKAPLGHGAGIGVVYYSIVGPVRFYVGVGKTAGVKRRIGFELSAGPDL